MTPDEVEQFRSQGLLWQEVANLGIDSMTTDDVRARSARLGGRNAYGKWAQDRRDQIGLRRLEREVERYKERRGLASRRTPAEDVARDEGISLEEAQEIVDNAQEIMDEETLREMGAEDGEWNDIDSRARRLNPGHYANAPLTGTGQVWPPMSRQGSYDLMGGANYAGPEVFTGTLADAIDRWVSMRRNSDRRTPLWGSDVEPDDTVIWSQREGAGRMDGGDADGIPLLTRSDVEAAFEARGLPAGGDLDAARHRDRIERGAQDSRPAGTIMSEERTQGPTGEPGGSAHSMVHIDLDVLDEEVQNARAHYRAMVEEPEQDPVSVEDQLGAGGEIESLHRTRPHELRDMSIDELNKIGAFWLGQPSAGSREHSPPGRSIRQEIEVRREVEKLRADFEGSDRQRMISRSTSFCPVGPRSIPSGTGTDPAGRNATNFSSSGAKETLSPL